MKKELIFIFMELFTIRNLKDYSKFVIFHSRNFIVNVLKESNDYSQFKQMIYKRSVFLDPKEFSFIMSFMIYLKKYIDISY